LRGHDSSNRQGLFRCGRCEDIAIQYFVFRQPTTACGIAITIIRIFIINPASNSFALSSLVTQVASFGTLQMFTLTKKAESSYWVEKEPSAKIFAEI
jgi:hypothetical protein